MKKKIKIIIIILMVATSAIAQNRSIAFNAISLKEAFDQAKIKRKMVFVDCYTEWCVPCRGMDKLVFTVDSIADFFNQNFINVKMDMEKPEGRIAMKTYTVGAFPTYLLFDENGNQLYKFVGGMPADEFMAKIRIGINPKNELASREARYLAGERDPLLMRALIKQKFKQKEIKPAQKITEEYFNLLNDTEKVKPENWLLFEESFESMYISDIGSRNFSYLLSHYNQFKLSNGKEIVDSKIYSTFKKLASYCLLGYYFKNHPYLRSEFEEYKEQINNSKFEDKEQLNSLVAIAMAAGEKNAQAAGQLLTSHIAGFTQKNMNVVFDYINFCSSVDRSYPYIAEISTIVSSKSSNPYLVKICQEYTQKKKSLNAVNK